MMVARPSLGTDQPRLLRWACLAMACTRCTAMNAGCLSRRAMHVPSPIVRTTLPVCLFASISDDSDEMVSSENGSDLDDGEDVDDGVESVAAYLPQLLEAKYGKNWETLLDSTPGDDDDEDDDDDDVAFVDFEDEEEGLRWLVMQQMKLDEENGVVLDTPGE